MVLVSFVLVVVAAITLVIGLLQSGLTIIYVSIGCSVLAGIVLATAVLRGRPGSQTSGGPSAGRRVAEGAVGAVRRDTSESVPPTAAPASWVAPEQEPAPLPSPTPEPEPVPAGVSAGVLGGGGVAAVDEREDRTEALEPVASEGFRPGDDFPIHGYDKLRATEILPMLAELTDDQLEAVEERERGGKSRAMVLKRIEQQKQTRGPDAWDADDEGWDGEPEPAAEPAVEPAFSPMAGEPVATAGVGEFPIPDFDDLKALEVLGRLPDLTVTELHLVRRREEDGLRRAMVLNRIDRLIEEAPPEPEPIVVVPPKRRASATRRSATRASTADAAMADAAPDTLPPVRTPAAKRARTARVAPAPVVPAKRARTAKTVPLAPAKKAAIPPRKAPLPTKKASASTRKAVAEAKAISTTKSTSPRKAGPARKR